MKVCGHCLNNKDNEEFYTLRSGRLDSWCKFCRRDYRKDQYVRNGNVIKTPRDKEQRRKYYQQNKEWILAQRKVKYRQNPRPYLFAARLGRHRKKEATPGWLTYEDKCEILSLYAECKRLTESTGIQHHVDHEIPLRGVNVSGLHVPSNLRIMVAHENIRKSNFFDVSA